MISALARFAFDARACEAGDQTFFRVVLARPLVVYVQGSVKHCVRLHRAMAGREACLLRGGIGCEEHPKYAKRWSRYQRAARKFYPEHRVVLLANTRTFERNLLAEGADVHFCSQNGLLDERLFRPMPEIEREFDAVMNAQMEAVKRHWLAGDVKRLAIITYRLASEPRYYERMRRELGGASWLNFTGGSYSRIAPVDMSRQLSRARVGLILSAAEGANYATVEYLLTGLPVVSTRSLGGRDVFFDERCVVVADDDAEAVAQAVHELAGRQLDPAFVRSCVLPIVLEHRRRFIGIVQHYCDDMGVNVDLACHWPALFENKMLSWMALSRLEDGIAEARLRERQLGHGA